MQYFTIKDIENLCGIKAHTLRIWELRYNFFKSKRKESTHRIYDNDDLKQLLRIAFLYHSGWKVSRISSLSTEQILEEVKKAETDSVNYNNYVTRLIEAAVDFNEAAFMHLLETMIATIGFEKCITEVCYPYLQRIGMLWVTNRVVPAQEHFSSYLIQNKVISETDKLVGGNGLPDTIVFCPQGEFHELPLLFINYLLKKNGWQTIYLGSNIKKDVLQQFANDDRIKFALLHLITNFTGADADIYFEDVCRLFKDKLVIASGTIVHQVQRNFVNLKLLKSDKQIYEFIKSRSIEQDRDAKR